MAPTRAQESSDDYEKQHNVFMDKLVAYHDKRGTHLEKEPKVGNKVIDLLQLFNAVVERGGYDKVSDEKLAWRKLGQEFNLGGANNLPTIAFALKSTYYRNLAAYEISTIHGKEPPPKEILEETTAKGGGLLTRTLENFRPRQTLGSASPEASGEDGTPERNRQNSEETPGSGGRVTRGLRQAPPQRVLFQPDTLPSRQTRQATQAAGATMAQPSRASSTHNPVGSESLSSAVANYEPRPPMPLTLRPVLTPGNNFTEFQKRNRAVREQAQAQAGMGPMVPPRMMLPGTGFEGPNIYLRCLLALKSGIRDEQNYALHHLVKISMERGDKYRFESFPGLAEALVDRALEVGSLFYEVDWDVVYPYDGKPRTQYSLDGVEGTPDLLELIAGLTRKDVDDNLQPGEFSDRFLLVIEAALTLRNMVMLEENAVYVAEMKPVRDLLVIILNLPNLEVVIEAKHYALDIAEQITRYIHLDPEDPLYVSLLAQLEIDDRGAILTSLRAISRISMNLEESNRLENVQSKTLQSIIDWMLLDDEELILACLDFLYQYTAVVPNVNQMVTELNLFNLVSQLSILLTHGVKNGHKEILIKSEFRRPSPTEVPLLPRELVEKLFQMEEPERSSSWLRCLFEEDKDESITQIALWQAYQTRFSPAVQAGRAPLLAASDFIKNVSATFADRAAAQVQPGLVQRFIIKGIRIREVPVDFKGREYTRCNWTLNPVVSNGYSQCREHFMTGEQLWEHILTSHLLVPKTEDGKWSNVEKSYSCLWGNCQKYRTSSILKSSVIASHVKLHATRAVAATLMKNPDGPAAAQNPTNLDALLFTSGAASNSALPKKPARPSWIEPPVIKKYPTLEVPVDERGEPTGIPLSAALVLRNLARNLPKTEAEEVDAEKRGGVTLVHTLYKPVEPRLWEVFSHCRALAPYLADLLTNYAE